LGLLVFTGEYDTLFCPSLRDEKGLCCEAVWVALSVVVGLIVAVVDHVDPMVVVECLLLLMLFEVIQSNSYFVELLPVPEPEPPPVAGNDGFVF